MGTTAVATIDRVNQRNEHHYAEYQRYVQFERNRILRNELTDASERLTLPMNNEIIMLRGADGEAYSEHGESMRSLLENGIVSMRELVSAHPDYEFELQRRLIELQNYSRYADLNEQDMLVEFSTIPDAVRHNRTSISGYNRARLKMIVRITQRRGDTYHTRHMSLDQSNRIAIAAMADVLGHDLPLEAGSEAILAAPAVLTDVDSHIDTETLAAKLRDTYDGALQLQYGGEWFAGRQKITTQDALTFISAQTDLIDQHMQTLDAINRRKADASLRQQLSENARFSFAAALDDRLAGKQVTSVAEAGEIARMEQRDYGGDCPTETSSQSKSFESSLESAGYMQGKAHEINGQPIIGIMACVSCPFCKQVVDALVSKDYIACPDDIGCGKTVNRTTGAVGQKRISVSSKAQLDSQDQQSNSIDQQLLRSRLILVETIYEVGGAKQVYRDKVTGATGSKKELQTAFELAA